MEAVNGKKYRLWGQFIDRKSEWIGGYLFDEGEKTEITDITLEPSGSDSAYFTIHGKEFDRGFDVMVGGVGGDPKNNGLCFGSPMSTFEIVQKINP